MKQGSRKENKVHEERTEQRVIEENEEEEQYMTIDEDGRPYIAVRRKQGDKQRNDEEVKKIEEEDMENLIREYQENARPSTETVQVLRLYGEGDWRKIKELQCRDSSVGEWRRN